MRKLGIQPPSSAQLLEQRTPHADAEGPPVRVPWLTPVLIPALLVLLIATVLIYVFAAP
ncbi:hypothetical protein SAMN02745121_02317 [Nannocystis exedens]|uniref:Uncharacterized protein n=1 Tax=Nannocystis exedens TaxID=54 RepID=A0A1I1WFG9_9BACT|nr:hypothetical protein [Nannocystis exedens]PCC67681.1 hypothetical protein NAEX_00689 [Nannocystis exedens]SFD93924.1 hypothetical protein SAMN02745121_02317 [Nannocystis exedens]